MMKFPELTIKSATAQDILDSGAVETLKEAKQLVGHCPPTIRLDGHLIANGVTGVHLDIPADGIPKMTVDVSVELKGIELDELKIVMHRFD